MNGFVMSVKKTTQLSVALTKLSDMARPDCDECGGEGFCTYDDHHGDGIDLPCQECFPPEKNQLETSWEDLRDDEDNRDE